MDLPKMIREQTVKFIDSQEIDRKINESVKEVVYLVIKHQCELPFVLTQDPSSDMKEILLQRMLEENYDKGHAEETKKKSKQDSPKTLPGSPPSSPPPPPPPSGASRASGTTGASDSASRSYHPHLTSSIRLIRGDVEEVRRDHIPTVNLRQSWWKPLTEDRPASPEPAWTIPSSDLPTGDITTFMDCYCKRYGISALTPKDLEGPAYEIVKAFHPDYNDSTPLPLVVDQGHITIQSDFFFQQRSEYLRYGSKDWQTSLIEEDARMTSCDSRPNSHAYLKCRPNRSPLNVKGYDYMKKIITSSADLKENGHRGKGFSNICTPSNFEESGLLNLQDKSRDEYKILDEERRCQKQGVHVRYPETAKDTTYLPESGKLCWWTDSRRRLPEILLKMNLPDHRSVLTDPEDQAKMEMETPRSSGVNSPPNAHT
ncbi:hypothetical protein Tco_0486944 [Tanacetum coccineum]